MERRRSNREAGDDKQAGEHSETSKHTASSICASSLSERIANLNKFSIDSKPYLKPSDARAASLMRDAGA
jgi:hypothetical protein